MKIFYREIKYMKLKIKYMKLKIKYMKLKSFLLEKELKYTTGK